jgi:hypothetical protein
MARLSWGRRTTEDQPPDARVRSAFVAVLVVSALVAGVDGFVHRSVIEADTPERIQQLLDQHLSTIERRDLFQYERTQDRQSAAHRSCKRELYEMGEERASAIRPNRLIGVEEAAAGTTLVRAYIQQRDGIATEYIRRATVVNLLSLPPFDIRDVFHVWYLSSPSQAELGGQVITGAGDGTLESWGVDAAGLGAVKRELETLSAEFVHPPIEAPGATARPPLRVRLLPAPEFGPNGCVNGAVYDRQTGEILLYPRWADAERSSLSEWTRIELRHAYRLWDRTRAGT